MKITKEQRMQKAILDTKAAIKKRQRQLETLRARRAQLDETLKQENALMDIEAQEGISLAELWNRNTPGYILGEVGIVMLGKHIRKYGFQEVIESMQIAASTYIHSTISEGQRVLDRESIEQAFEYIGRICYRRAETKKDPDAPKILALVKALQSQFPGKHSWQCEAMVKRGLKNGKTLEEIGDIIAASESWNDLLFGVYGGPSIEDRASWEKRKAAKQEEKHQDREVKEIWEDKP
jgi:hypothetical protein